MSDKTSVKKRIYQVAKELNISHETLINHLRKQGHKVLGLMSLITEEMMTDIQSRFKKEREDVEKHQRKIHTILQTQKKDEEKTLTIIKEKKVNTRIKKKIIETQQPTKKEIPETKPQLQQTQIPEIKSPVEVEQPIKQELSTTLPEIVEIPVVPQAEVVEEKKDKPTVEQEKEIKQSPEPLSPPEPTDTVKPSAQTRLTPRMGLKIMGKINLAETAQPTEATEILATPIQETEKIEKPTKKKKKKKKLLKSEMEFIKDSDEIFTKAKKKKKLKYFEVDQEDVHEAIKRTLAEMDEHTSIIQRATHKRKKKEKRVAEELKQQELIEKEKAILRVTPFITVNELATLIGVNVAEVIKKCIALGLMVSINQRLDEETIIIVADEFGFQVEFLSSLQENLLEDEPDREEDLQPRPPVVTIMGHVNHGKTSLLDYIRESNVVAGEIGGITQHIGAYSVNQKNGNLITFLDTPGHEAFTAMRARGTQVTDIVVLVVAADESVMPQTLEAINHAQAANVPIIIAINKCDKADANPDRVRQQLAERNILVEEWGGKYQSVEISARTGKNIDLLLEKILLEAETLNLKANPKRKAVGVILEARVDKGKGIVATVLIQKGTLKIGDSFVAGTQYGRVRGMFDERNNRIEVAKPSTPTQITGFDGVPQAGDTLFVVDDERTAREISLRRQRLKREQDFRLLKSRSLNDISQKIQDGLIKELKVIVKGDVDGSVGALADSLMKITHEEVRVNVIHRAVGPISESDVLLAAASNAVIIGFHVRPHLKARRLAEQERVDIRFYDIIYDAINDIKAALAGLLSPLKKEEITATISVRDVFKIPKVGTVAGCYVQEGKISRGNKVRVIRDGIVVYEGGIRSLKRFKEDVREVEAGFECGIGIDNFNDIKVGDTIDAFRVIETHRSLT